MEPLDRRSFAAGRHVLTLKIEEHDEETKAKIEDFLRRRCSLQPQIQRPATLAMVAAAKKRSSASPPQPQREKKSKPKIISWYEHYEKYVDHIKRNGPNAAVPSQKGNYRLYRLRSWYVFFVQCKTSFGSTLLMSDIINIFYACTQGCLSKNTSQRW